MLPTQRYLDDGRDAKNRFIALDLYMETHGGKLPPDAAHPPSIEAQLNDSTQWHIAVRFNGPSDAFNHFAQDASFNRGAYRVMENIWGERASRAPRHRRHRAAL